MKNKNIAEILIGMSCLVIGCNGFYNKKNQGKPQIEYIFGSDNSIFLLKDKKEGIYDFQFYRDKNNDGFADTKGKGFYLTKNERLIPKFIEEDIVLKYDMEILREEWIKEENQNKECSNSVNF